ncbi:retropepsin-like aspartic protease [Winogradskyella flava]|uniref:retropepsin-like aspartic protease n=1 Tax=Winogradskyella flava TaxID=1884876 RepID=UPI001C8DC79E|nr:aspartyl protease family protein [Winogradskyella flava]
MKILNKYVILCLLCFNSWLLIAQGSFFLKNDASSKIHFELINNLIVIPIKINGTELSFILDTGVSRPILFNLTERDSLNIKNTKTFFLHGLGADGKIEALKSSGNKFGISEAVGLNQDLYVIFDSEINFTPRLGVVIHGIIGYDIFKDFVVEINYNSKYIRLHKPDKFRPKTSKKWRSLPIDVNNKRAYVNAKVTIAKDEKPVKLLIDTGSSDSIWLFEDVDNGLVPHKDLFFVDFLGKGLSGSIYGKRSKVDYFKLSDFNLENANVAYPDSTSINAQKIHKDRNGSLGGDILKRFNIFFDYTNGILYFKKNSYFKDPFNYNNSGIVVEYNGTMFIEEQVSIPTSISENSKTQQSAVQINTSMNYRILLKPIYKIVELRESSNAYASGLRIGDVLIGINGKRAYDFKLNELNEIFYGKTGKTVYLKVERNGQILKFKFKLDNAFKKNELPN